MKLAKCGQDVAMIELYREVGGGCTHWGTIPSKALRHSVQMVSRFRQDKTFRRVAGQVDVTWQELVKSCLLYTSPSPRDGLLSRMPSSA